MGTGVRCWHYLAVTCTGLQSHRLADIQYTFNKARYTERGPRRQLLQMLSHPGRWSQVGSELCGANKPENLLPSSDVSAGRSVRKKYLQIHFFYWCKVSELTQPTAYHLAPICVCQSFNLFTCFLCKESGREGVLVQRSI